MTAAFRACALMAIAALLASAQQPPTLRITVTLVQVDAVVTDSQGRHVAGLSRDDFQVLQDGEPQKITYFAEEAPPAPSKNDLLSVSAQPITSNQVKRTLALVVDDLALSFESLVG